MKDKTEFLFESDAEKAAIKEASKPKKPKIARKIIVNSFIFSALFLTSSYFVSTYEKTEISKLGANMSNSSLSTIDEEKMDNNSTLVEYFPSNNKYEVIVNKANTISEDEVSKYTLVNVENNLFNNVKLEEETYNNYLKLKEDLLSRGYYINIRSGFRTFNESKNIYNSYAVQKGETYAKKYVAAPGTSEHNTGLALDIVISDKKNNTSTNYDSDEYFYLENTAYLYGFIIRYPKDKEIITGYEYEPWHLRYVGYDLAKYLKKSNLTLEEYYNLKG